MTARRVCPTPGCPELTTGGRCTGCARAADERRPTSTQRGYGRNPGHRNRFRATVLARDPICVIAGCQAPATVADHWPTSRRDLLAQGHDPDDPTRGRGLCASCHGRETAMNPNQRGGWNDR